MGPRDDFTVVLNVTAVSPIVAIVVLSGLRVRCFHWELALLVLLVIIDLNAGNVGDVPDAHPASWTCHARRSISNKFTFVSVHFFHGVQ